MSFLTPLMAAAILTTALASAVFAAGTISVIDPYAIAATPMAKSGAAFMVIANSGAEDDVLIGAATEAAMRSEMHTHEMDANGVMQMSHDEQGFVIPAGGTFTLKRGGSHLMLMGLAAPLLQGDTITLRLTFEHAGEMVVEVPVDLKRD